MEPTLINCPACFAFAEFAKREQAAGRDPNLDVCDWCYGSGKVPKPRTLTPKLRKEMSGTEWLYADILADWGRDYVQNDDRGTSKDRDER